MSEWKKPRYLTRAEKDAKFLDDVEKLEENYRDNMAGPYYINRAMKRNIDKLTGKFKKKRYKLTDEDIERLNIEREADELKRARRKRSKTSGTA